MDKGRLRLSGLLLLALTLAACGGGGGKKEPPSASRSAADLRVTSEREVEIADARILSLSPDGEWLAVEKRGALCVYGAESLAEQACVELESGGLDLQTLVWAPDSTRLAFTENVVRYFYESDLWVLEAETGKLTNLTDDGVVGGLLNPEPEGIEPLIDTAPAWSPDSETLVFARSVRALGLTTLYHVPAKGGDPQSLLPVVNEPFAVWRGMRWSSDGKEILYTVSKNKLDEPENGIWIVEENGENSEHILRMTDPDWGPPFLADVAAKGAKALIVYYYALGARGSEPNVSYFGILDLKTGEVEPLKRAKSDEIEFASPGNAVFSPDGSKVLYTYRAIKEGEFRLAVRDVDGETENILFASEEPLGTSRDMGLGLNWANDDTVFVASALGRSGFLLSVGPE